MTIQQETIQKISSLPEQLAKEANDFIDFIIQKNNVQEREWKKVFPLQEINEADFSTYLPNLEDYEHPLARGEISW